MKAKDLLKLLEENDSDLVITLDQIKQLAELGKVISFPSSSKFGKQSTLDKYMKEESSTPTITHVNKTPSGQLAYWLKSYGLGSWNIEIEPAKVPDGIPKE